MNEVDCEGAREPPEQIKARIKHACMQLLEKEQEEGEEKAGFKWNESLADRQRERRNYYSPFPPPHNNIFQQMINVEPPPPPPPPLSSS